jgi:hypothetical protein
MTLLTHLKKKELTASSSTSLDDITLRFLYFKKIALFTLYIDEENVLLLYV